jgi:hypothetical protein
MTTSQPDTATPDDAAPATPSRSRGIVAVILFVIASLLLPIGVVAFWGQRTLIDTEQYVTTVAPLSSDPQIKDAVAGLVSDQVVEAVNIGGALSQVLPAQGQLLVGPLTSALDSLLQRAVRAVMDTPQFQKLWVVLNTAAQKSAVALLEGKPDGPLQVSGDTVVLDTTATYQAVREAMINDGVPFASKLPAAPPKNRQIVVLQSAQLERVQTIYSFTKPLATWLLPVVIVLFIVAIVLSRRRPRMLLAVGISVLVSAVLIKYLISVGQDEVSLALQDTPLAVAEGAFVSTLTRFLINGAAWMLGLGIAIGLLGWLFGQSRPAGAIRAWTGADEPVEGEGVVPWLQRYGRLLALAAGIIVVAVLLALNLTVGQLMLIAVAAIAIGALLWFGMQRREERAQPPAA